MPESRTAGKALRVRFEVPRTEVARAQVSAAAAEGSPADFDREHLRGRVHIDVGVPFEPDPVLEFLRTKRGLDVGPPHTTTLDQPVAYVVSQLAAATVMAAHGEPAPMIMLSGGAGAIGVAREADGALAVSLPLEQYAGVALVPAREAAGAVAAASRALLELLQREVPPAAHYPLGRFLARELAILEGVAAGEGARDREPLVIAPRGFADLAQVARAEEAQGAHVVPYWSASAFRGDPRRIAFEPLRAPTAASGHGALARLISPAGARLVVAAVPGNASSEAALRLQLSGHLPFLAMLDERRELVVGIDLARDVEDAGVEGEE